MKLLNLVVSHKYDAKGKFMFPSEVEIEEALRQF